MVVSPWDASTSSVHLWASPVSGWQFASSDRCKSRSPLPFSFFTLHSPKLSFPIPWIYLFFTFLGLFCSQVCTRLNPWFSCFGLSFSSEQAHWLCSLNQDLSVISSHCHFLFVVFIKTDTILFIHLLVYCLSPTVAAAAAAAKLLQSCPTLCDSIDSSPPGSPISGINLL